MSDLTTQGDWCVTHQARIYNNMTPDDDCVKVRGPVSAFRVQVPYCMTHDRTIAGTDCERGEYESCRIAAVTMFVDHHVGITGNAGDRFRAVYRTDVIVETNGLGEVLNVVVDGNLDEPEYVIDGSTNSQASREHGDRVRRLLAEDTEPWPAWDIR